MSGFATDLQDDKIVLEKGTKSSAGYEVPLLASSFRLYTYKSTILRTGITLNLLEGYHAILMSRSSTLNKKGIIVETGLIDSDYKGEILIQARALQTDYQDYQEYRDFENITSIAQLVIHKTYELDDFICKTEDNFNHKGFGSTD